MTTKDDKTMRSFDTGATRDTADGKLLYDKFLCPRVLKQFAKFMNMNRLQSDGQLRDGDNWQKGIPMDLYLECLARHHHEFWTESREVTPLRVELMAAACGILFNVMGYMHEWLKTHAMVDFDGIEPTVEMRLRQEKVARELNEAETAAVETYQGEDKKFPDPCGPGCGCGHENGFAPILLDDEVTCVKCRFRNLGLHEHPCDCCEEGYNYSPK